ncbi:MAG: DUF1553 domain-containing protein [Acidobacteriota bacterium]|nr:DUF1553 domain-containing protein [Acidobacteriota bacterium]
MKNGVLPLGLPVACFALALGAGAAFGAGPEDTFTRDIRPILERSCWNCHGAATQTSGLDLRSLDAALTGGRRGPAIVPGRALDSRLYRYVAGLDDLAMPAEGDPLTPTEVAAVRDWIDEGAHWDTGEATVGEVIRAAMESAELPPGARDYWAFRLPAPAPVPEAASFDHPVDRFLEVQRQERGVHRAPKAERTVLIRRAYLDLVGLLPSPEETSAFVSDTSSDAWERLIDLLLGSPHYGERWGRHWLDVARYADSSGYEQDYNRPNAWRYRDYVVAAFNDDKPYDRFLEEQIAGDELDDRSSETLIATGFLRAGPRVLFREKDNPERRHDYLDDVLATLGRGVLGLTVHCARCHDHKFDPILQRDYYGMQASIFGYVETQVPLLPPEEAAAYLATTTRIDESVAELELRIKDIEQPVRERLQAEQIRERFSESVQLAVAKSEAERTPGEQLLAAQVLSVQVRVDKVDQALSAEAKSRRESLRRQVEALEASRPPEPPMAEIVTDGDYRFAPDGEGDNVISCPACRIPPDEPGSFLYEGRGRYAVPPSYFLLRGDAGSPGSRMEPGFVAVATYGEPATEIPRPDGRTSGRRLALAKWIASDNNPLTARVMVNRIWHHHFGRGIVRSLDNFGTMGDPPTHQGLLDWLAVRFVDQGWSIKEMHRLLMTSQAYQMASAFDRAANGARDPENDTLWRFRPRRLDAEIVRDVIMSAAGTLDLTAGGPGVFPWVPEEVLVSQAHGTWNNTEDGPAVWRRSVYVYRRRSLGFPFFDTFDLPDQNQTAAARNVSTVPTQALTLLNNSFVLGQAERFALRVAEAAPDLDAQVDLAYRKALSRPPTRREAKIASRLVRDGSLVDLTHVLFNLSEFLYLR